MVTDMDKGTYNTVREREETMTKKERRRRGRGALGLAAALAASLSLAVFAGPGISRAASETIGLDDRGRLGAADLRGLKGRAVREAEGFLYHSTRQIDALGAAEGSMEFTVRRTGEPGYNYYPLAEFMASDGEQVLAVYLLWRDIAGPEPRGSALYVTSDKNIVSPWGEWIPLGRAVPRGGTVTLTLTWGAGPEKNRVYVDGAEVPAYLQGIPKKSGRTTASGRTGFQKATARAQWLRVPHGPTVAGMDDADLSFTNDTEILGFVLHDRIVVSGGDAGPSDIAALYHDAAAVAGFSGKLVAGDVMTVTMEGTAGQAAAFDVARLTDFRGDIPVSWKGWGVYLEEKTFFDEGEIDLRDVDEYRVYLDTNPIDVGAITEETPFVEALEVEEQSYIAERLEPDTPYYLAVMAVMDDGSFLPVVSDPSGVGMKEVEGSPGVYEGTFAIGYKNRYPEAVVVGRLGPGESAAVFVNDESFEVDPSLNIEVVASVEELKADEKSTSEITVTVTDANGDTVPDHEVRFVLATTSQYTGVVGGGAFANEVGGTLERDFWGETSLFGQVTATYTAGFAAKTAIVVARDMLSNDTGVGYVKTYINATAQLELEAVQQTAGKALGYAIAVTSSDEWLTADGESEARITALVTKDGIPVEGHRVGFTVSAGSGRIRTIRGETGSNGKARAVYTAGTKIGVVLIRATDHTVGITGTVQIELRSDAPAKVAVTVTPEVLPADGRSTADVAVVVTDINDNPNEGIEVEYAVAIGSGRVRDVEPVTDRNGESTAEYVAGRLPGKVSIEVTVRSTVPTEEEMAAARDLAVAVLDYDFF
jgi:hypothetical protein